MRTIRAVVGGILVAVLVAVGMVATTTAAEVGMSAPEIAGGPWINSAPLTTAGLRGRVVLVEFWTYG